MVIYHDFMIPSTTIGNVQNITVTHDIFIFIAGPKVSIKFKQPAISRHVCYTDIVVPV